MKNLTALILAIFALTSLHGCGLWDKPDFREVKWGMSKRDVKKKETAELVKEGDDVLTYRITGDMLELSSRTQVPGAEAPAEGGKEEGESDSIPVVTPIHYEYDLLYVFGNNKLGMAVIHLRESLPEPEDYIEIFKEKSRKVSETIGVPARGVAEYPTGETPRPNPYETPEDICGGRYVLKHIWPTDRKKTNVSLELDKKKFSSELDCNLSIFYESTDVEIDPVLRDQLHEVL
jgi:hypothetical protein